MKLKFLRENYVGVTVFMMGIAFVLTGIGRGESAVVLKKAVNICLECIGIG